MEMDTERLKRVMDRVRPPAGPAIPPPPGPPGPRPPGPPGSPPPPPPERCREEEQLCREEQIVLALRAAMNRSRRCRQELMPWVRSSEQRQRRLRTELYLRSGDRPPREPPRRQEGVLSSLRRAEGLLREAETEYGRMARDDREDRDDRRIYDSFAAQCRRNRQVIRGLMEQMM